MKKTKKVKIGIIGCGTIGAFLAREIVRQFSAQAELTALCDTAKDIAVRLKKECAAGARVLSLDTLIKASGLVIEAASAQVSFTVAEKALRQGKDVMIMSTGGILDNAARLFALAKEKKARIFIPSGAIAGLDAVKAAALSGLRRITLTTRKPPEGLETAPYLKEKNIDLNRITTETLLFEGDVWEAVKGFPKNINVCAALSLAADAAKVLKIKIIVSPGSRMNIHEIEAEGDFGRIITRTENTPFPGNPKTSRLAAFSALATLKNILDPVKIGT